MNKVRLEFCMIILLTVISSHDCQSQNKNSIPMKKIGYNLSSPEKVYNLPASLFEISGISDEDASTIACVQDENGVVFLYDLIKNQIKRYIVFGGLGDYEDLSIAGDNIYILRSDEVVIGIKNYKSEKFRTEAYEANIPGKDTEGLCYDRKNNRLLITPKEIPQENPDHKGKRFIYGFDLATGKIIKGPVLKLDIHAVEKFAADNKLDVPMKGKKGESQKPDIKLRISALGTHPITNSLFVLSGPEQLLFVFNMSGQTEYIEKLNRELFPQPEGITFFSNGDMLISNEGNKGPATMLHFRYRPVSVPTP